MLERVVWAGLVLCATVADATPGKPVAAVECTLGYMGEERVVEVRPTPSPYTVEAITLERFDFRAVWLEGPADVASLTLDVAVLPDDGARIPLHHAKHRPPYPVATGAPYGFTGLVSVYEQDLGREFQYWCRWKP